MKKMFKLITMFTSVILDFHDFGVVNLELQIVVLTKLSTSSVGLRFSLKKYD
jgi:hypothetical protein